MEANIWEVPILEMNPPNNNLLSRRTSTLEVLGEVAHLPEQGLEAVKL